MLHVAWFAHAIGRRSSIVEIRRFGRHLKCRIVELMMTIMIVTIYDDVDENDQFPV
jgi:hypothetical protein